MTLRHLVIPLYLVLCILLGGASAAGFLPNFILQILALAIIVAAIVKPHHQASSHARTLIWLMVAMILLVLIQLIPLPPGLWSSLPGRAPVAEGYELLGQPAPWLPLTLEPDRTVASLLWLLPAFAALLGVLRLGAYRAPYIAWALACVTVASVLVGAMQLTGGRESPLYFYAVTNWGQAVGFFSNSNHQATLLLCTIPFIGALYADAAAQSRSSRRSSGVMVVLAGIAMIILVGLGTNGSLAGLGLALPVIAGSFLIVRYRREAIPLWAPVAAGLLAVAVVVGVFVAPLGSSAFSQDARGSSDTRRTSVSTTLDLAQEHLPLGSGIGSFANLYRQREDPRTVERAFMNHAHSDFAEVALETGIPGLILVVAVLLWWFSRIGKIWSSSDRPDHFARAAVIASAAVLVHSLVDYPLRTAAIASLFAVFLALMAQPRSSASRRSRGPAADEEVRHLVG